MFSLVTGLVTGWFTDWQEGREDKRIIARASAENKARLLLSDQSHNQSWEMAQLEGKDVLLQRLSFMLLSLPFVWAMFAPETVENYFTVAIASVPDWYQWIYIAMIGAIWGISEMKKFKKVTNV